MRRVYLKAKEAEKEMQEFREEKKFVGENEKLLIENLVKTAKNNSRIGDKLLMVIDPMEIHIPEWQRRIKLERAYSIGNNYNSYMYVNVLFSGGKIKTRRVHILLAKAFLYNPNPKIYKIVGHKDNDKHNNDLSNLYWTTNQENTQKAVDDGLNKNKIAQDNENSNFVKVLDKDTLEIVGIYGSYRECNRCIENSTLGSISRMCNKNKIYKPRSKKYIYLKSSREEFEKYPSLQNIKLIENLIADKSPTVFKIKNTITSHSEILDNQTTAEKITGIPQATISHILKEKDSSVYNGWIFEYLDKTTYKNASAYENFIKTVDNIIVENIYDGRKMEFRSGEDLKKYFGVNGHDLNHYIKTGHTLLSEWKIISKEQRSNCNLKKRE